jgi:hypothetical protein
LGHGSEGSSWVNIYTKMVIIVVLKPDVEVNLRQDLGHESWGSVWVDLSQHKNYSNYYHSLKTRLGSQSRTRSGSLVGRVNQVDKKNKKKSTQPGFGQKIWGKVNVFFTRVLSQVDSSFWMGKVRSIIPLFFLKNRLIQAPSQLAKSIQVL